jgi:hypothetical protein
LGTYSDVRKHLSNAGEVISRAHRGVKIDEVQTTRSLGNPTLRELDRVTVNLLGFRFAANELDASPTPDVNARDHQHVNTPVDTM